MSKTLYEMLHEAAEKSGWAPPQLSIEADNFFTFFWKIDAEDAREYERARLQKGYDRLAFLHTETMAELIETRKRMDEMSKSWWAMLKHRIAMRWVRKEDSDE
jgi:hypothetical protein